MGFLRRQEPQPPPSPGAPAEAPRAEARCWFCWGPLLIGPDLPPREVVALLLEAPDEPSHALAHRTCAERAAGHRIA